MDKHPKRNVSFSSNLEVIETVPWNSLGLTPEQKSEGKHITRAFRKQFPGLPKFTFFDDEHLASEAERAANDARRQTVSEHAKAITENANEELEEESSLDIGMCTTGRGRGTCGLCIPGNLISALAISAAAASAASASAWEESVEKVPITASPVTVTDSADLAAESNQTARKAPRLPAFSAAFRWMECKPALVRHNSSSLPMSIRLQRFDSVEQAHARFTGKSSHHGLFADAPRVM